MSYPPFARAADAVPERAPSPRYQQHLADRVRAVWAAAGHRVEVEIVVNEAGVVLGMRSSLANGWPA